MTTVREATFELFREHGMTTIFGNPGSTELPMLADFPDDFRYVLGLQEAVVVGMADGYAQASGRADASSTCTPRPGVGNAMGAIFNAQANKSPLLVTAGQQARALMTLQANLTNRDATRMPHPLVKWSYEPPRAEDVPLALARGDPPRRRCRRAGPVFVSIPMDDWDAEVDDADARARDRARGRRPRRRRPRGGARRSPQRLDAARNPVLVAGPDIDASGAWDAAVALAERQRLPVWAIARAGRRAHRLPRGPPALPGRPAAGDRPGRPRRSRATTWSSSSAPRSSPTTRTSPGRCCPRAPRWSRSPATPTRRRARRWATRSSPTSGSRSRRCSRRSASPTATGARAAARARGRRRRRDPLSPSTVARRARRGLPRRRDRRARVAVEHARAAQPAAALAARQLLLRRRRRPRLRPRRRDRRAARPARPAGRLRARRGLGAVRDHRLLDAPPPTTSRSPSSSCATRSTRSSSGSPSSSRSRARPGLDLPALDVAAVAEGYGVAVAQRRRRATSCATRSREALALGAAASSSRSPVAPGMALF